MGTRDSGFGDSSTQGPVTPVLGMLALGTWAPGTLLPRMPALGTGGPSTWEPGTPVPGRGDVHRHRAPWGPGTPAPGAVGTPAGEARAHRYRAQGTPAHEDLAPRRTGPGHSGTEDTGTARAGDVALETLPAPVPPPLPALPGAGGLAAAAPCRQRRRKHVVGRARKGRGLPVRAPGGRRPCGPRGRHRAAAPLRLPSCRGGPEAGASAGRGPHSWTSRSSAAPRGPARRRPASRLPGRRRRLLPAAAAPGPAVSAGERRRGALPAPGSRGSLRCRWRPSVPPLPPGRSSGGPGAKLGLPPRAVRVCSPRHPAPPPPPSSVPPCRGRVSALSPPAFTNPWLSLLAPGRLRGRAPSFCDESLFGAKPEGPAWAAPWMRKEDVAKLHTLLWSPPPAPRNQPGLSPRSRETPLRAVHPRAPGSAGAAGAEAGSAGEPCLWKRPGSDLGSEGRGAPVRGRSQSLSRLNTSSGRVRLASGNAKTERCETQSPLAAPATPRGPLMRGRSKSISGPSLAMNSKAVGGCKPRPPWK